MIVTYQGSDSFKVSQGDLSVSINPANERGKADIALFSLQDTEWGGEGFKVSGPGEYEVKDVSIKGFPSTGESGRINTIYMVTLDGMNLCFLGALASAELESKTLESLENIDILLVPIDTLDPAAAAKLAVSLEPGIIIPTRYTADSLKKFLKEAGSEGAEEEKLVVKKKDLEGKEGEIIILKAE